MNLKRARDADKLTKTALVLGTPILSVGYLIDFLANMIPFTILFLEFPQELLVTARLSRHIHDNSWRGKVAKWFCSNLLDQFDPSGCHCK